MADRLLEVRDLQTSFRMRDGVVRAVDGATFGVDRGEVLGLVGESGCGKSVTSLSILRLITPPGQITGGSVHFDGRDLLTASEAEMQKIRGNRIAMIFQQPNSSLNPVQRLANQIGEVLRIHKGLDEKAARMRGIELLELVGIPDPGRRADAYPHEISGGMAQRVMIAMAISCAPTLLIADEPTTGLDVTTEHQILELLREMRDVTGAGIILITHDLNMAAEVCDRITVMYAGNTAETAPVETFFSAPRHPYTLGLLASRPRLGEEGDIPTIPGNVPDLIQRPTGCPFHPRCRWATEICAAQEPEPRVIGEGHVVACHHTEVVARDVIAAD